MKLKMRTRKKSIGEPRSKPGIVHDTSNVETTKLKPSPIEKNNNPKVRGKIRSSLFAPATKDKKQSTIADQPLFSFSEKDIKDLAAGARPLKQRKIIQIDQDLDQIFFEPTSP